jgi:2-polyprenyl-6-methoxyphenol hydroxylase-like FAD-dependent oxidoreductase
VVLGGGFAGLVTAGALTEFYERVTVVERDPIPAQGENRRGVPQGRHTHNLLPGGARALEEVFPGILAEMVADGAVDANMFVNYRFYVGGPLPQAPIGAPTVQATRPFYERHLRRRLADRDGVRLLFGADVLGLEADEARTRFTGVRVATEGAGGTGTGEETLAADLIVDAMGRGSRTPVWLEELGYPRPEEVRLDAEVAYASRTVAFGEADRARVGHLVGGNVNRIPRGILLLAVENGGFLLTLNGTGPANRPPADDAEWREFLTTAAPPDIVEAVASADALGHISSFRFPTAVWRRYDELRRFPDGLLVVGDAVCVLNPLNAQGLTVAALQAAALRRGLRRGSRDLSRRFRAAAARIVAGPWQQMVNARTTPARFSAARLRAAWMMRVVVAAHRDPVVGARFGRVLAMVEAPSSLQRPATAWRVLRASRSR